MSHDTSTSANVNQSASAASKSEQAPPPRLFQRRGSKTSASESQASTRRNSFETDVDDFREELGLLSLALDLNKKLACKESCESKYIAAHRQHVAKEIEVTECFRSPALKSDDEIWDAFFDLM